MLAEPQALPDLPGQQVPLVLPEPAAQLVLQVPPGHLALPALPEPAAQQVLQARLDLLVQSDRQAQLARPDLLEQQVLAAFAELRARLVPAEPPARLALLDPQGLPALLAPPVLLAQLV